MKNLSQDQLQQLNSYSNYIDDEQKKLFNLSQLFEESFLLDAKNIFKAISQSDNDSVALSYFTRRYGMFIAMQFYMLTVYDEFWDGPLEELEFGIREEYGRPSLCIFTKSAHWVVIDEEERKETVANILEQQCDAVFQQIRKMGTTSALTHWENVFGYLLWHYHTLLSNPATEEEAREYVNILEEDRTWNAFSDFSRFRKYTGGSHPSALINLPVRKSCCFSKDVPGLMACGFCPLT